MKVYVPLVAVVVVLATLKWPDGSLLLSVIDLLGGGVVPDLRVPERVKGWLTAGVALEVVMVMLVGVRGVLLTVLDCLTAGLELGVVAVTLLTVLDCLTAGLELGVVAVSTVDAGCASTAGVALQNNNAQTTNTTAATIATLFSVYIPPNLEHQAHTRTTSMLETVHMLYRCSIRP